MNEDSEKHPWSGDEPDSQLPQLRGNTVHKSFPWS